MARSPRVRRHEVTPPKDVLDYFRDRELAPRFSWLDVFGAEHAHAFTVAKAVDADVLTAFWDTIDDAIARGLTYESWHRELEPRLRALGWWGRRSVADPETGAIATVDFSSPRRLENIFWSNMRAARAAAQWERAQATKEVLPYFLYVETTAAEPRQEHLEWVGTILPIDHPFWRTHYPPNGWGCKCAVRQIGRAEAARLGGVSLDPEIEYETFRNRRTGETVRVPRGIDPGWHTSPGYGRGAGFGRALAGKIGRIPDERVRATLLDGVTRSPEFSRLVGADEPPRDDAPRRDALPIAEVPADKRPPDSNASIAVISRATVAKQLVRHPGLSEDDYRAVQELVRRAEVIPEDARTVHLVATVDGKLWRAVLKRTDDGEGLYITSLHRFNAHGVRRLRRRSGSSRAPGGS